MTVDQEIQLSFINQEIGGSPVVSILKRDNAAEIAPDGISGRLGV